MKRIDWRGLRLEEELDRYWLRWALLAWFVVLVFLVVQRWNWIYWLALGDTDDNMRLMQVRALLNGQGWYDLRQYRLNPPVGFDIHWSRLVDLPIAGLILIFRPIFGNDWAERLACGIAPVLPLSVAMTAAAYVARRLIDRLAWPVALIILLGCASTMLMFMPLRIDHHGWQLACLSVTLAGMIDPRRGRGGVIVGMSSAASLTIGLEMLPYCAIAGAILGLRWVWDRDEARRLQLYGATLAGGSALGFAIFASNADQVLRCDALTPVWLSVMVVAGALLFVLAWINPHARWLRLLLGAIAGAAIAAGFAHFFPQCLGRPEQVSDELARTWLNNVREAKPIYRSPLGSAFTIAVLPVIGLIGSFVATWRARHSKERLIGWATATLFMAFAAGMLLWQVRAGPAAQMLAVPGATALVWIVLPWCLRQRWMTIRVFGSVAAFLVISGLFAGYVVQYLPAGKQSKRLQTVNRANGRCTTIPSLRPLDRLPPSVIFTHVDLGPRLITVTRQSAVAGPYHRNGDAILDVHHAFTGPAEQARAIMLRHHATYLLVCPNMAETTVYRARNPNGFYAQLAKGKRFAWLEPMPLPRNSPLRLWRIR